MVAAIFVVGSALIAIHAFFENFENDGNSGETPIGENLGNPGNGGTAINDGSIPPWREGVFDPPLFSTNELQYTDPPDIDLDAINANRVWDPALEDGTSGQDDGFAITGEDVLDTTLDFIPIVGSGKDIYKGIRDGDGWQVAMGVGFLILDVATLGGSSMVKGAIKTGAKFAISKAGKHVVKKAVKNPRYVGREVQALANPRVEALMRGKGIDRAFRDGAQKNIILKAAQRAGLIEVNPMNRGADLVGKKLLDGTWWDVTTSGAWQKHVDNYGPGGLRDLIYKL